MSEYVMPDYRAYATLNDWFARRIRPELRPIYGASNPDVLVAAADARTLVFSSAPGTRMWLKGDQVSLGQLLGPSVDLALFSDSAPVIIHRLAPGDYHRFHAPSDATIVSQVVIPGPLYSVSADAMTAEDGAIYNHRMVMLLQDAKGRMIAYVALGATCVGSIVPSVGAGAHVTKGAEIGYFQFGGSTIVVVLQSATPSAFISDLALAANQNVETLVRMGTPVAAW
ncbi:hypothetical protein PBRA_000232 [Plasmodiophora brassicae]|nr:hypothetical protein PBRA_000232 [Plasmodiophora brassicae]